MEREIESESDGPMGVAASNRPCKRHIEKKRASNPCVSVWTLDPTSVKVPVTSLDSSAWAPSACAGGKSENSNLYGEIYCAWK